jgi:hypothetical protein
MRFMLDDKQASQDVLRPLTGFYSTKATTRMTARTTA